MLWYIGRRAKRCSFLVVFSLIQWNRLLPVFTISHSAKSFASLKKIRTETKKKRIMQTHAHTHIHKKAKLHIDNWVGFISILLLRFRIVTPPAVWFSTNMQRISNIAASNLFVLSMLRLNGLCRKSNQTDLLPTLLLDRRMGRFLWWLKSLLKRLGNNNGDSNGSSHAYWMYAHMHNNFSYKRQSNGMTNFAINPVHLYSGDGFLCWSRNDG